MKTVKAGVIGLGFIGPAHIEALRRIGGVEVTAVASGTLDKAMQVAEYYSIPRTHDDWNGVITDENVEVVHNCTPNYLHFEINRAAILAGKHVVSEKPLTVNSQESGQLVRLARKNRVVNAVNFNYRFYPLVQQARKMMEKGELGDVYLVHGHYLQDWLYYDTDYNWRLEIEMNGPSRAMADIGSHWCDLVQFVTGRRIRRLLADLVTVHNVRKTEDAGSVLIEFDGGARGVFTVSQVSAGRKNRLWFKIDGSKRAISWDQEKPNELWIGYRDEANGIVLKDPALLDGGVRKYAHYPGGHPEGYPDGLKNVFATVYDFIRQGKDPQVDEPDFPTFEDGHLEVNLVEAILKSHRDRKWVEVRN